MNDEVTTALERLADQAPHHPDLAGAVRERARRGRRKRWAAGTAAVAVVAVAGVAGLRLLPHDDAAVTPAGPACQAMVTRGVLPEWARTGFTDPEPVMSYASSTSGNVVAILFTDQLSAPPRKDINNKVLWAWQDLPDPTTIKVSARLDGTGPATTQGLPSPAGPSYVDLPTPGCWRLTLTWPGGHDTVDLQAYAPR